MIKMIGAVAALSLPAFCEGQSDRCDVREIYKAATEAASLETGTPETAVFTPFDDAMIHQTGDICMFTVEFRMETTNLQGDVFDQRFRYIGSRSVDDITGDLKPLHLSRID